MRPQLRSQFVLEDLQGVEACLGRVSGMGLGCSGSIEGRASVQRGRPPEPCHHPHHSGDMKDRLIKEGCLRKRRAEGWD